MLTVLDVPNFFSVPITAPDLWAAFKAERPFTTFSRSAAAPPPVLTLLPMRVTLSQSASAIMAVCRSWNKLMQTNLSLKKIATVSAGDTDDSLLRT